ncbi:MAG: hypothetical protein R2828_23590 [Saprospiraceae bacterium]
MKNSIILLFLFLICACTLQAQVIDKDRYQQRPSATTGNKAKPPTTPIRQSIPPIKKINYIGQYPKERYTNWSTELQGVTHDTGNWFFTQAEKLWKFPLTHDLNKPVGGSSPAHGIYMCTIPDHLAKRGYNHFCDLDYFDGYLFVPIEGPSLFPLLLVYKAANLEYIGSHIIREQTGAGWCAIDPIHKGLYSSNGYIDHQKTTHRLNRYAIDFELLKQGKVVLTFIDHFYLWDESGKHHQNMKGYMQGGDFSEDGKYLYLVNGKDNKETAARDGGIWVFDTHTHRLFTKSYSTQSDFNHPNYSKTSINENFKYEYHPGRDGFLLKYEEPEGITVGNINGYKIKGQIHVIMLDNGLSFDELYFKHYEIIK